MIKIASAKLIKMTVLPKASVHAAMHASLESPNCRTNVNLVFRRLQGETVVLESPVKVQVPCAPLLLKTKLKKVGTWGRVEMG